MKKNIVLIITLIMALVLITACSPKMTPAQTPDSTHGLGERPSDDTIMIQIGDYKVTFGELEQVYEYYYDMYVSYQMLDPEDEKEVLEFKQTMLNYQLENVLPAYAAEQRGIELDEKEQNELQETYDSQLDTYLDAFADQVDSAITDQAMIREAKLLMFKESLKADGKDFDTFMAKQKADMRLSMLSNKMLDIAVEGVEVTDDEIKTEYDKRIADTLASYEEDVISYYEAYQKAVSGESEMPYVAPEGYYFTKHIYIHNTSEEEKNYDPEALLAEVQAKVDTLKKEKDVDKRIESFQALIDEYGQDYGMETEPFATEGYLIHNDMTTEYFEKFLEAARTLKNKGDISVATRSGEGIHILIRLEDVSSEPKTIDEVKEKIKSDLIAEKEKELYAKVMEEWKQEFKPVIRTDLLPYIGIKAEPTPTPAELMTGGC